MDNCDHNGAAVDLIVFGGINEPVQYEIFVGMKGHAYWMPCSRVSSIIEHFFSAFLSDKTPAYNASARRQGTGSLDGEV